CSAMSVCEAANDQRVLHGHVYIAPGDSHLSLYRDGARYYCRLSDSDPVNRHRPSVDVLFDSVAKDVGKNAIGVMLTGMGKDGALGMKAMHDAGARTLVQDEASSVVWGMPGAAVAAGGVDEILPLEKIGARIVGLYKKTEK
ncbi:MAG: CheB methylesterase domain-containing protein, partial [Spongiibacteraceae bacterium]